MNTLYFAHYEQNTKQIIGWYNTDIHAKITDGKFDLSSIPTPKMEVSFEGWQAAVNDRHNKVSLSTGTTLEFDFRSTEQKSKDSDRSDRFARKASVRESTINFSGDVFQSDEESLKSMATTVVALDEGESVLWRLEDNTEVMVTREGLRQALRLGVLNRNSIMEEE